MVSPFSMLGLRGGESLSGYRLKRDAYRRKISGHEQQEERNHKAPYVDGSVDFPLEPQIPSLVTVPFNSSHTVDFPLRVKKTRRQRSSQGNSYEDEVVAELGIDGEQQNTRPHVTPRGRRRGPSLSRFNLRRKFSAQELVATVKDAYHSRPSLNLSRSKVQEPESSWKPLEDLALNGQSCTPTFQRQRAAHEAAHHSTHHVEAHESSFNTVGGLHSSHEIRSERKILRRLSLRNKERRHRRSQSLGETGGFADEPFLSRIETVVSPEW
jgi:hypothetical protein